MRVISSPHAPSSFIPSYNTGLRMLDTVAEARRAWAPVWVVLDGSTDGTGEALAALAAGDAGLRVLPLTAQ